MENCKVWLIKDTDGEYVTVRADSWEVGGNGLIFFREGERVAHFIRWAGYWTELNRKKEMDTQKIEQALEMARCADSNMENLAAWLPRAYGNPMFVLVRAQVRSAIDLLEGGDGELKISAQPQSQPGASQAQTIRLGDCNER